MKEKNIDWDWVLIAAFVLIIIAFVFALKWEKSEGAKCLDDPLGYAQELSGAVCGCVGEGETGLPVNYCADRCPQSATIPG